MAQVVEADMSQTVFIKQVLEPLGNVGRAKDIPPLGYADVVRKIRIIAFAEMPFVEILLFLLFQQHFINRLGQRECSTACFVLHFLLGFDDSLAVPFVFHDFCIEEDGFLIPIYPRPTDAQRFATS